MKLSFLKAVAKITEATVKTSNTLNCWHGHTSPKHPQTLKISRSDANQGGYKIRPDFHITIITVEINLFSCASQV